MYKLSPSMLSADFSKLREEISVIEKAGAEYLHLDIMDGNFVPNITFGAPVIKSIRPVSKMVFDAHLMISEPEKYIGDFISAGADIITVHAEACKDIKKTLAEIKGLGAKAGVTIKPATPLSEIEEVYDMVDMVLVMTVNPGFSGQKLIPEALDKVRSLRDIKKEKGYSFEIEIDGGVSLKNIDEVLDAGAEIIVAGSAVFDGKDPAAAVSAFIETFKKREVKK